MSPHPPSTPPPSLPRPFIAAFSSPISQRLSDAILRLGAVRLRAGSLCPGPVRLFARRSPKKKKKPNFNLSLSLCPCCRPAVPARPFERLAGGPDLSVGPHAVSMGVDAGTGWEATLRDDSQTSPSLPAVLLLSAGSRLGGPLAGFVLFCCVVFFSGCQLICDFTRRSTLSLSPQLLARPVICHPTGSVSRLPGKRQHFTSASGTRAALRPRRSRSCTFIKAASASHRPAARKTPLKSTKEIKIRHAASRQVRWGSVMSLLGPAEGCDWSVFTGNN